MVRFLLLKGNGMSQILKFVCFLTLMASVSVPAHALQLEVSGRADNSLDEQPPLDAEDMATLKMNLDDCGEMNEIDVEFTIFTDVNDNTSNELYFFIGNSCNEGIDENDCEQVLEEYAGTITSVQVSFWELFQDVTATIFGITGTAEDLESLCSDATNRTDTHSLWVALLSDDSDEASGTWAAAVSIEIDIDPPIAPKDIDVSIGESKATVSWDKDDVDNYSGAYVLNAASTSSGADGGVVTDGGTFSCSGPLVEGNEFDRDDYTIASKKVTQSDVTSTNVSGLINGATYQFSVVSYDDFLNRSVLSEVVCAIPWTTCGFYCDYNAAGGSGGGKYCFVATAAFGSYDHPVVKVLRGFRDEFLEPMPGGEAIISAYYSAGPTMARVVGDNAVLRFGTQAILMIFAGFAWILTAAGPSGTGLGLCVLFAFVMGHRISRRRRR